MGKLMNNNYVQKVEKKKMYETLNGPALQQMVIPIEEQEQLKEKQSQPQIQENSG